MPKTANKISFLIESQLPDFINEEYELFGKFIQKYYEQLEVQGQPLDIIQNIQTYRDIDYYEKNVLKQSTTTSAFSQSSNNSISVVDASSFPENGGYIKINDEICFYNSRTDTEFLEVSRGVSGNTTIGDLYESGTFITTQAEDHVSGSTVQNISNLFLYALIKSFESQYLTDFPEAYLKGDVDKRTLIKNISSFYQSKGTESSIKFLFKCLIDLEGPDPEVLYPRDFTLKSSESDWINVYALKAKILSGNATDLIGHTIIQDIEGSYASAIVDNVVYSGKYDGQELYEIILADQSINGEFSTASRTKLTKQIDATVGAGDRIDVFSTMAWGKSGEFNIGPETITYHEKNINQFVITSRNGTGTHTVGTPITYGANVSGNGVDLLIYGVLYNLENDVEAPYSNPGDVVEISDSGFITDDVRIVDEQNNLRWILSSGLPAIPDLNSNVSGIFEDGEGYYIASSGWPSHAIGGTLPSDAQDQKNLKIIRKTPVSTTETYETKYRDVGIALNGIPFLGYKDEEVVLNGPLQTITVNTRGVGYAKEPFVLIDGVVNLARTKLAGQVVESVVIDTPGSYTDIPTVEILSGRDAKVTAVVTNGEITSITVNDAGEYYSSPPIVRITDKIGKGRFAEYTAEVSNDGAITGFVKVTGGSLYTQENTVVDIIPVGSGATATATIREWRKDRYYKSTLDSENGSFFKNYTISRGHGYAYYASPTTLRANDTGIDHSSILGFAYDGNPIYGAYGHINPLDSTSAIVRMTSSYIGNTTRVDGPSTTTYPIGTFIDDWTYTDEYGSLDANNGRFCVTPEFPDGTYAYFITVDVNGDPRFPYILGNEYYSLPLDSNYNSSISQDDIPIRANRYRSGDVEKNGDLTKALIDDVKRGSVSSASIVSSGNNFRVGLPLVIDDSGTDGYGVQGEVESVKGRTVSSIESQDTKALYVDLVSTAYLFNGDTITQSGTGATGSIVGDVFSAQQFALRSVTGTFNSTDVLSSNTKVISLILDQDSSYTKGANLVLSDGVNAPVANGVVLETTSSQNTVKVRVTLDGYTVSDTLFLTSSDLINTTGSKILSIGSLSENLIIFKIQDNVALLSTVDAHGVGVNGKIDIDINPDDSTTETTYNVRKRIYQEAIVETPVISRVLSDTGIGRITILNGGEDYTTGTYTNIDLLGGSGSGAKATLVVSSSNTVASIEITEKGTGYKIFDELTIGTSIVFKSNASTPSLTLSVDHVGFSIQNAEIIVDNGNDIQKGDYLIINDEIVLVDNRNSNTLTVQRAQRGTLRVDHFDGASVTVYDPGYNLPSGHPVGDGYISSYDPSTQKIVVVWDYSKTTSSITPITLSTVFFDEIDVEGNKRLVKVLSVTDPDTYFEFSKDNITFTRNPVWDIKKYYMYKFDTTHGSMSGVGFDISPSINFNLVTPERVIESGNINIKLGYGSRVSTNTYNKKYPTTYTKYYYYDRDGFVNSEKSYFNVINDPLEGEKTALYVTTDKILYSTDVEAPHDGSGTITYTSDSIFSIGEINSVKITNIGTDYKKIPIVTGIYDNDGKIDTNVLCFLNSSDIGVPRNIRIINNGGSFHNDKTLKSSFKSNYILTVSGGKFSPGETVVQKSGATEIVRARVTSWRKGSNIITVDRVSGIFRKDHQIIGLAKNVTSTLLNIDYTTFSASIKTYYDNLGYYQSDFGKIGDQHQKLIDSYFYQDYSYIIKSRTSINTWRSLIKETTHPAGFQLFGEVLIDSTVESKMSDTTHSSKISVIQVWDPEKNKISIESTRRQLTQSIVRVKNTLVERGIGSVSIDTNNTAEISAGNVFLSAPFDGALTNNGNLEGTTTFNLIDDNGDAVRPYNEQALVITLDGILQEPVFSYTIDEDKITFSDPPIGPTTKDGQVIGGVKFYGRKFQFKDNALNAKYLKKIKNIFQRTGRWIDAANQLDRNRKYIQSESLGYIKNKYPEFGWSTSEEKCYRDIGFIVDALSHDLRFGGNWKTVSAAEAYFTNGVLTGVTGQGVVTDASTGDKTSELEATMEAFTHAIGLAKLAMDNRLSTGTFTTVVPYLNNNILLDSAPTRCEDVENALTTLNGILTTILSNGTGTVTLSNPDYFDGENKVFDLYYEDGSGVDTQVNEDLFIALSGVLQHNPAYTIDRTNVPNKIVFDTPPIWGQGENTKTVQEALAVEKFFGHGIGNYQRCKINTSGIRNGSSGPFLVLDPNNDVKIINDPRFALVFIDGVLQREVKSYVINGPTLKFTKKIYKENNIEILVLYGRDIEPTITLYDFQKDQYYNEIVLSCKASSANTFGAWKDWYGQSYDFYQVAYQKIGGTKRMIGVVKNYTTTSDTLIITLAGNNPDMDSSSIFFARSSDFADEYELTGTTDTVSVIRNSDNDYQMQRGSTRWLYGTPRADEAFYERNRLLSNLNVGDLIQIDGEDGYRTINGLPQYVNPKTYNPGEEVSTNFFGSVVSTNYGGNVRGVGLSASCEITNGSVSSITWNRTDFQKLYDEGVLNPSDAYGYDTAPIIHFIPVDQNGGGARAEVKVSDGHIVDISITNPGSGYTKPPKIVTARQYNVIKQNGRKIDSHVTLNFNPSIAQQSPVAIHVNWAYEKGVIAGPGVNNLNMPVAAVDAKEKIFLRLVRPLDLTSLSINNQNYIFLPPSFASVSIPDTTLTSQGTSFLELDELCQSRLPVIEVDIYGNRTVQPGGPPSGPPTTPFGPPGGGAGQERKYYYNAGFVDLRRISYKLSYEQGTLGPRFLQWEGAKFMSTGDILSTAGYSVSAYTIEEFEGFQLQLQEWENNRNTMVADNDYLFNLAYPSINNYMSILDTADVPDENGAGYIAVGDVIYANTSKFPASGTILLGREQISYTSKLIDRFIGCTRGVNGTPIDSHPIGEHLRNAQ